MMVLIWLCATLLCAVLAEKRLEHVQVDYSIPNPRILGGQPVHEFFRPIRIRIHEGDFRVLSDNPDSTRIRDVIRSAVNRASSLLKVFPVSGSLYLSYDLERLCEDFVSGSRDKCRLKWDVVPHDDCDVEGDFLIPSDHYGDFRLYSSNSDDDYIVDIEGGAGLPDTDIVLYISVRTLQYCNVDNAGILAFTKICKRDQFGRPIASFINICPSQLSTTGTLKLSETVFHELLHALGFVGSSLKFLVDDCTILDNRLHCEFIDPDALPLIRKFPYEVLGDKTDIEANRYEFPMKNTHDAWADHVNCYNPVYEGTGPVWVTYQEEKNGVYNDVAGDHWAFHSMMGSLMSPFVREPYMQVLDNLTVAVFNDMGWYVVSDNYTEPYLWGKNSGCTFSYSSYCTDINEGRGQDRFLCPNIGEEGCHYLHLHKGSCTRIDSQSTCQYFKPEEACFQDTAGVSTPTEKFCVDCRCFVVNRNQAEVQSSEPICLQRRCLDGLMDINVDGEWINCPYGQTISVDGIQGAVQCPPSDVLCTDRDMKLNEMIDVPQTSSTSSPTITLTTVSQTIVSQTATSEPGVHEGRKTMTFFATATRASWSWTFILWCLAFARSFTV